MLQAGNNAAIRTAIGLGTGNTPTFTGAVLDADASGGYQWIRFKSNSGSASDSDFGMSCAIDPNAGNPGSWPAEPRFNCVFFRGYNVGPAGAKLTAGDHRHYEATESRYKTVAGIIQLEQYWDYTSGDGTSTFRPFGWDIDLTSHNCIGAARFDTFAFGFKDTTNDWLKFYSTSSEGNMLFYGNSWINYLGTSSDFVKKSGLGVLGVDGSTGRVFYNYADFQFGGAFSTVGTTLTLRVGSSGSGTKGLRWNHSTAQWEFESNLAGGGTEWLPIMAMTKGVKAALVNGSLGNVSGDYVELGSFNNYSNPHGIIQVDLIDKSSYDGAVARFIIPRFRGVAAGASWHEVAPLVMGGSAQGISLDVKPSGTSEATLLRVRRKTVGAGAATVQAVITCTLIPDTQWTTALVTGSGATASRYFPHSVTYPLPLGSQTVGTSQATIAHGLGYAPSQILITMTSAGNIYRSATSDATNIYLTADSSGRTAEVFVK